LRIVKNGLSIKCGCILASLNLFSYIVGVKKEADVINKEVEKRLSKGEIIPTTVDNNDYFPISLHMKI